MNEDEEFDDPRLPPWATGKTDGTLCVGAQLATRDGRRVGNACITHETQMHGTIVWQVLTDAGHVGHLTAAEIADTFYSPRWVMDPATAPGNRK